MRKLLWVVLIVFACGALLVLGGACWFYFYSRDLPDMTHLRDFAPASRQQLIDECLAGTVAAIPFDQIGKSLRDAAASLGISAEADSQKTSPRSQVDLSLQIARTLLCHSHDKRVVHNLKELRIAIQLDRHFSMQELLTIYLNRVSLGECGSGVENAAQCLFHKSTVDLDSAEAALIAGMINSPSRYSPTRHPDRALARRNAVLDAMVAAGKLSLADANAAKSAPLLD